MSSNYVSVVPYHPDKELELNDNDENKNILTSIHRIGLLCSEKFNCDKTIFENEYNKVLDNDFKYEIEGKKKLSKDRKHKASIYLSKNLTCSIISVVFYDKLEIHIKTFELLKSFQQEMFYGSIIKNNKWFNNNEFGLYTPN